jgi:hypothetical protein
MLQPYPSIKMNLANFKFPIKLGVLTPLLILASVPALAQDHQASPNQTIDFPDVDSSIWAADSIRHLNERYGCLEGFPDGTFQGEESLTRYQFAAGLYACLSNYDAEIQGRIDQLVTKEDLAILFRVLSTLFEEASPELEGESPGFPNESPSLEPQDQNLRFDPSETPSAPLEDSRSNPSEENIIQPLEDEETAPSPRDR